jgi:type III pantothenate kinase
MLLAIDIGNTHTVLGLFSGTELIRDWRIHTVRESTADEYGVVIRDLLRDGSDRRQKPTAVVIASVVPPLDSVMREMCRTYFALRPIFVTPENLPGLRVRYREPSDVGADRVVNVAAALAAHAPPLVIVDFGTATTFDVINADGEYVGGAIVPGIGISLKALFSHAARLPSVDLVRPPHAVGQTTEESIQSGVLYGYASLVEGMLKRISREAGDPSTILATGGFAPLMAEVIEAPLVVDTHLTLRGLCLAHRLLQSRP